jgi:hypothetical protein
MFNQPSWNCNWRGKPNARRTFIGKILYWAFEHLTQMLWCQHLFHVSLLHSRHVVQKKLLLSRFAHTHTHTHTFLYAFWLWISLYWNFLIKLIDVFWNLVTFSHILMGTWVSSVQKLPAVKAHRTYPECMLVTRLQLLLTLKNFPQSCLGVLYHHGNIKPGTHNTSRELRALKEQFHSRLALQPEVHQFLATHRLPIIFNFCTVLPTIMFVLCSLSLS